MPSEIMIGQFPLIIGGDKNVGQFASSSGLLAEQAFLKDAEVSPTNAITNALDSETLGNELDPNLDSEDQDDSLAYGPNPNGRKRKRYHRHTLYQIQEMESFFKMCPNPDDKQRKQLGRDLGLEPLQVKFWFQNKRTQMKTYHERADNLRLKAENEKLRAENITFREALIKPSCPTCRGSRAISDISADEHHLRVENIRLREEVERIGRLAGKYIGKPCTNFILESNSVIPNVVQVDAGALGVRPDNAGDFIGEDELMRFLIGSEFDKSMVIAIAASAVNEIIRMSEMELPLWVRTEDNRKFVLNKDAYEHIFPRTIEQKPAGFITEASRDTGIIKMNHKQLIEVFMDMDKWFAMFASMVSSALVLKVISPEVEPGNRVGALQIIGAEFQVITPAVLTREYIFARHCKQLSEDTWIVVDFSCDNLLLSIPMAKCQRRPSGCVIQELSNDCSKVTWIEHVEMDDQGVHYLGRPFAESGLAFGAQRWIAVLAHQCERLASVMGPKFSPYDINDTVVTNPEARKNISKLSERMIQNFYGGVITSSTEYSWKNIYANGNGDVRIMTKKNVYDPGMPSGIVLNATTFFWIPVPQTTAFEFLRDESNRKEWDILCNSGGIQELMHITNGHEAGNYVALIRGSNVNQEEVLILQECSSNSTGSSIIYAPVDRVSINQLFGGKNPDQIAVLPSGFTIFPSVAPASIQDGAIDGAGVVGSLVTIGFQILVDSVSSSQLPLSAVSVISGLIQSTKLKIKVILAPNSN